MRLFNVVVVLAVALVFASAASAGQKGQKKAKKKMHAVHGVVTAVDKDSVTVQVKQGKKKGGGTTEKKFQLNDATKYETMKVTKVKGQKAQKEAGEASFGSLKKGAHVLLSPKGEAAAKVSIVERTKKNKKKAAA
jgi:hypothetical protein